MSTPESPLTAEAQAQALTEGAGLRIRDDLIELQVSGDDARGWLNGQITADVRHTEPGQAVYALVVTVKGKIMADAWVLDLGEGLLSVLLPAAASAEVQERFESQIIMEDVELSRTDRHVLSVQGPCASAALEAAGGGSRVFPCDELGLGGCFVVAPTDELDALRKRLRDGATGAPIVELDEGGYELCRLRRARPRFGLDFDARSYPQEAGLKERAVSFNKGCYLGQEVVCTLESRGKLSRALQALAADQAVEAGTPISDPGGKQVGWVSSGTWDPTAGCWIGLGHVKRVAVDAGAALDAGGASLRLRS